MEKSFTKEKSDKLLTMLKELNKLSQELIGTDCAQLNKYSQRITNEASKGYIYFITRATRYCEIRPCKENIEEKMFTFEENLISTNYTASLSFQIFQIDTFIEPDKYGSNYWCKKTGEEKGFWLEPELRFNTEEEVIEHIKKIYT